MGIREGKSFKCGQVDHADFNSSFNIALRPPLMEGIGQLHTDRDACKGSTDTPEGQLQERWRPQNSEALARRVCQFHEALFKNQTRPMSASTSSKKFESNSSALALSSVA